jgi:hypothetical protein
MTLPELSLTSLSMASTSCFSLTASFRTRSRSRTESINPEQQRKLKTVKLWNDLNT